MRRLGEALAQAAAAHAGMYTDQREDQIDRLRRLRDARVLPPDVADLFHALRKAGNAAVHDGAGDLGSALHALKFAREAAIWFHRTFDSDTSFKAGAFIPPRPPEDASKGLREQIALLKDALASSQSASDAARATAEEARRDALSATQRAAEAQAENAAYQALLDEAAEREGAMVERIKAVQVAANRAPATALQLVVTRAEVASQLLTLDEADTRALIDVDRVEGGHKGRA